MTGPTVPSEAVEAMKAALIAAWNEWDAIAGRDSGAHTVFQHAAIRALAAAVPVLQAQERERLETRVEYGHQTYPVEMYPGCPCYTCDSPTWPEIFPGVTLPARMSLCPKCGNKRCPAAANHANQCSGSNKPRVSEQP